jgi:hypothetical protein
VVLVVLVAFGHCVGAVGLEDRCGFVLGLVSLGKVSSILGGGSARQINLRATHAKPACAGWLGVGMVLTLFMYIRPGTVWLLWARLMQGGRMLEEWPTVACFS